MSERLFDIFGDCTAKDSTRTLTRQPLTNNENFGKSVSTGPLKPNEPTKKNEPLKKAGDLKKSFLSNTGTALRDFQTPAKKVYSPRSRNIESSAKKILSTPVIYTDELDDDAKNFYEELEFTRPWYRSENYHRDLIDFLLGPEPKILEDSSPPNTPPPVAFNRSMEFDCSYQDDFFTDDFAQDSEPGAFAEDDFPLIF